MHPSQTSIRSDTNRFDAHRVQLEEGVRHQIQLGEKNRQPISSAWSLARGLKLDREKRWCLHNVGSNVTKERSHFCHVNRNPGLAASSPVHAPLQLARGWVEGGGGGLGMANGPSLW
jgi:hypothetical protein